MKTWLTWTNVSRVVGIFAILVGASTWPEIHGEVIIAGLGFLGAPTAFGRDKK
jgi:hypothetical protein